MYLSRRYCSREYFGRQMSSFKNDICKSMLQNLFANDLESYDILCCKEHLITYIKLTSVITLTHGIVKYGYSYSEIYSRTSRLPQRNILTYYIQFPPSSTASVRSVPGYYASLRVPDMRRFHF